MDPSRVPVRHQVPHGKVAIKGNQRRIWVKFNSFISKAEAYKLYTH